MNRFDLFDAVRVVSLPEGRESIRPHYSETKTSQIQIGDIGVVLGDWPGNRYRVEAVNSEGAIVWQDHFEPQHLELLRPTAANFSRRRINEHWASQLGLGEELLDPKTRQQALTFARKVMAFARRNVEQLIERLIHSGYRFASEEGPRQAPEEGLVEAIEELAKRGVYVPVSLQAWLMEVGCVDFSGTHPEWPRTGYSGMGDNHSRSEPWFTDPLVIWFSPRSKLQWLQRTNKDIKTRWIEIAPDIVHKANISGGGPVSMNADRPSFDTCLVGQPGSFTLLSYLRTAFEWSGFPGFDHIPNAPRGMLQEWGRGLTQF